MWKDFFYFSRRERQGIIVLIALIIGIFLGKFLFTSKAPLPSPKVEYEQIKNDGKQNVTPDHTNELGNQTKYPSAGQQPHYAYTKPNQPAEKRNYYSLPVESKVLPKQNHYSATEKLTAGTIVEINASDSTQLMKIPGIGASFAKRIIGYRNLLGGYYRLEQIQEVYGMYVELYEKIVLYLRADSTKIILIPVNTASLDKLKSHPYLNFYQAKAIVEMRKKKGKLENIHELDLLEEFTPEDLDRLKHYLAF